MPDHKVPATPAPSLVPVNFPALPPAVVAVAAANAEAVAANPPQQQEMTLAQALSHFKAAVAFNIQEFPLLKEFHQNIIHLTKQEKDTDTLQFLQLGKNCASISAVANNRKNFYVAFTIILKASEQNLIVNSNTRELGITYKQIQACVAYLFARLMDIFDNQNEIRARHYRNAMLLMPHLTLWETRDEIEFRTSFKAKSTTAEYHLTLLEIELAVLKKGRRLNYHELLPQLITTLRNKYFIQKILEGFFLNDALVTQETKTSVFASLLLNSLFTNDTELSLFDFTKVLTKLPKLSSETLRQLQVLFATESKNSALGSKEQKALESVRIALDIALPNNGLGSMPFTHVTTRRNAMKGDEKYVVAESTSTPAPTVDNLLQAQINWDAIWKALNTAKEDVKATYTCSCFIACWPSKATTLLNQLEYTLLRLGINEPAPTPALTANAASAGPKPMP